MVLFKGKKNMPTIIKKWTCYVHFFIFENIYMTILYYVRIEPRFLFPLVSSLMLSHANNWL